MLLVLLPMLVLIMLLILPLLLGVQFLLLLIVTPGISAVTVASDATVTVIVGKILCHVFL